MPRLSVIIGVQRAQANLPAILAALERGPAGEIETLLCHAKDDPVAEEFAETPCVRLIEGRCDAPIPELWRDGILAAKGDIVAILTAHCVPNNEWLQAVLRLDMENHVAFGGPIENNHGSDGVGAAIYILRYWSAAPPLPAQDTNEIAADNAVYRRADILDCEDLLPLGFWEPSYHACFRQKGLKMATRPDFAVTHANRYSSSEFIRQRRRHGRAFGRERGEKASPPMRILMLLLSPAAFFVYGAKLAARIIQKPALRRDFGKATPWLIVFLASWVWGEARGYADAVFRRP